MNRIQFVYALDPRHPSSYNIGCHVTSYLREYTEVVVTGWDSTQIPKIEKDDIVIGHPNYPAETATRLMFNQPCRLRCTIHPFHTRRYNDNLPFDDLAAKADKIFAICGPYWWDTIDNSKFAHWKPKIAVLGTAIDCNQYKHRKIKFNKPKKRGIVYIGGASPNKNLGMLHDIAKKMPDVPFYWYGGYSEHRLCTLNNVTVVGFQPLTPAIVDDICSKCDFIISTSDSDANPWTLVEYGLAGGLIPVCTPESGFWNDKCFTNIPLNDINKSVCILRELMSKSSEDLESRSLQNREICERDYTWDKFCHKIWDNIQCMLNTANQAAT